MLSEFETELLLDQSIEGTPVQLRVNGRTEIALLNDAAREHGSGFLLTVGPRWIESAAAAPELTITDLEVGDSALGCD